MGETAGGDDGETPMGETKVFCNITADASVVVCCVWRVDSGALHMEIVEPHCLEFFDS